MERERLVIYLEKSDVIRMTSRAKADGETLAEWARQVLIDELRIERPEPGTENRRHGPRVRRRPNQPIASEAEYLSQPINGAGRLEQDTRVQIGTCEHKKAKGELCYKCDPKFGLPQVA